MHKQCKKNDYVINVYKKQVGFYTHIYVKKIF